VPGNSETISFPQQQSVTLATGHGLCWYWIVKQQIGVVSFVKFLKYRYFGIQGDLEKSH